MLEIRDIRIENLKFGCVTDHTAPEVCFSLHSDIPETFLQNATIRIGNRIIHCGKEQVGIPLDGIQWEPFTNYDIEICAMDNRGQQVKGTASFLTGRMGLPWEGKWITDRTYRIGKKVSPVPMTFRKDFSVRKPLKRAYITATAMGVYELMLNGEKVGDEYFAPGFTSYKKNLQYQYYDVTTQITERNTLTAIVAGGWAVGRFTYESKNKITADRQALLLELFLEYADGTRERIVTDGSWEIALQGNYIAADFYDGETFDATVDLKRSVWNKADEIKLPFTPEITVSSGCKVTRQETLAPVYLFHNSDGEEIYDFGQNFSGVVVLRIRGKKGEVITVRHAEVLDGDKLYTKSLRTAKATVTYICKDGEQVYTPKFTYMGFRYIGITGIEPENIEVAAYVLHSDFEEIGTFECSDEQLNKLQSNIRWSGKSNFVDIPTDCPQRDERQGWTGDISIFASTACYNFDMSRFLEKWLKDVRLEQGPGGGIPMVVPRHGSTPPVVATACWGDACILVPWAEYLARGNRELLKRQYPCMKKFMKAVKFWTSLYGPGDRKYIWKWLFQFGDWCAPEGYIKDWLARGKWMGTAYYANSAAVMAKIAEILGESEDRQYYEKLHRNICRAFCNILTDGHGKLTEEFQTGYVLPLYFGIEDSENRKAMADNLNRLVVEKDYHLTTGFPGTPYILFALADNGYADTAFRLLLQDTCPSWLYCIKMGATTFWEQWNAITLDGEVRDPSMNHYAYGAVGDFLYRRVIGLEPLDGGYRSFRVKPLLGGGLTWAKGSLKTPYGMAAVHWEINNNDFIIRVEVPTSTKCELVLPSGNTMMLESGTHRYTESLV